MKRFSLRIPKKLHENLRRESFGTGMSINELILNELIKKYKEENEMLRLVEVNEGKRKELMRGNLESIVQFLQDHEELCNWVKDEDPEMNIPNLNNIETLNDLEYELEKINLGWWELAIENEEEKY